MSATYALKSSLLRRSLQVNAVFSLLSGLVLVFASGVVGRWLGVELPWLYISLGVALLLFAVGLFLNAGRSEINLAQAKLASVLDVLWVLSSVVVILIPGTGLTVSGKWLIGVVADVVALFALFQWMGLRRVTRR